MVINQITIPCTDYQTSVEFYRGLGLVQIVDSPPRYARFESPSGDGATISLHLSDESPAPGVIVYFDHESAEELDAHVEQLRRAGARIESGPRDERWGWREARLTDPAGNTLCLMFAGRARRFPSWRIDGQQE